MTDPLDTAKLRLERAEAHISDIETEIAAFFKANPYEIVTNKHVNEGGETWNVISLRWTGNLPRMLPAMISDAAANIRSPLDYVVGRVYAVSPHPDVDGERLSFPIANSARAFEDELRRRKIATFSPDLAVIIRNAKPYAGGNDILFGLHHLARKDRHLDLSVIGLCLREYIGGSFCVGPGGIMYFVVPGEGWQSFDGDVQLASVNIDDFEVNLKIPLNVSVRQPEVFQGEPIADALRQSADAVKEILLEIERKFFR